MRESTASRRLSSVDSVRPACTVRNLHTKPHPHPAVGAGRRAAACVRACAAGGARLGGGGGGGRHGGVSD